MLIKDRLYGPFDIGEEVLVELIGSDPVQRLKKIAQYGVPDEYYVYRNYSRYEHSVGVMLLVRKLGASVEEQAAGLLHDVSHTAFSHVVDWLLGTGENEDHQDKIHQKIFMESELPGILERHGFDAKRVSDYKNFRLVEQPTPKLCADRVDYALREFQDWAAPSVVAECVNSLAANDGRMVFSSKPVARNFAEAFLKCQMVHWGGAQATVRYTLLSSALRIAIENKIITLEDLLKDDSFVIGKLKSCNNIEVQKYLGMLADKNLLVVEDPHNPQYVMKKKFRYVDPDYLENGEVFTLGKTDLAFGKLVEENRKINDAGLRLSIGRM
ncbi:MAG: HD domain-containing protein [Candidatus Aenigmarchaeota archaeon]|nr:HD domain-containing protein [Candidatus Aenigmarchaeota archaeon]